MDMAKYLDNTLLKPQATPEQIRALCAQSVALGCASVCVNPGHVALAAEELSGTDVRVCTVIGFPLGANDSRVKAFEASLAAADGAEELDMVINVGLLKAGLYDRVREDIAAVRASVPGKVLKVIIETALLTDPEKEMACRLSVEAGADFVKTSTGFSGGGATVEDIALMRRVVGPQVGVKASGGVRTREAAEALIAAGATRIGTSSAAICCR